MSVKLADLQHHLTQVATKRTDEQRNKEAVITILAYLIEQELQNADRIDSE